jgi:hypothetical protein
LGYNCNSIVITIVLMLCFFNGILDKFSNVCKMVYL